MPLVEPAREVGGMSTKVSKKVEWDRSVFAITSDELDVYEALTALSRLLDASRLPHDTLQAVQLAFERLSIANSSGS
jgi:hypothetical protein